MKRLTLGHRLRLCLEIMTAKDRHGCTAIEKHLSVFSRGYDCGLKDGQLESRIGGK